MARPHLQSRSRLVVVTVAVAVLAAPFVAAWISSPSVADLEVRLAARERATGVARPMPLNRVSLFLREAVVATEDERFYSNHGIDLIGIGRAIPYDIGHLSLSQGASTITDQLAKLVYLGGNDHSPWRKLEDLALSVQISTRFTKEQVLDAYLNSAYFGSGAYGVANAASRYFGRVPARLNLAQASAERIRPVRAPACRPPAPGRCAPLAGS
jgi:membrane peptidoglycan carboxypeptidase